MNTVNGVPNTKERMMSNFAWVAYDRDALCEFLCVGNDRPYVVVTPLVKAEIVDVCRVDNEIWFLIRSASMNAIVDEQGPCPVCHNGYPFIRLKVRRTLDEISPLTV